MRRIVFAIVLLVGLGWVLGMSAGPAWGAEKVVEILAHYYKPSSLIVVNVGDTIRFVNRDTFEHQIISEGAVYGEKVNSPILKEGESWTWTAKESGGISILCGLHPFAKARIQVK